MALVHALRAKCRETLPVGGKAIAIEFKQHAAHIQPAYHVASLMRLNVEAQYWYGRFLKPKPAGRLGIGDTCLVPHVCLKFVDQTMKIDVEQRKRRLATLKAPTWSLAIM